MTIIIMMLHKVLAGYCLCKENKDLLLDDLIKTLKHQQEINDYFLKVCKKGNLPLVKMLFEDDNFLNKPNLDTKDFHGNNYGVLHQACLSGNINLVKYLVEDRKIKVENNAFIFFYCRKAPVFKYMVNYFNKELQNEDFTKEVKKILIRNCFYDYDTFKEILKFKFINSKEEFTEILYHIIRPYTYDTNKEINDKHKIIKHLISIGANLYDEKNDIFITLMSKLTTYEKNTTYATPYVNNKIRCIKDLLNHLDKTYNYLTNYNIKGVIDYFEKNPESLNKEWSCLNNLYIKNLIEASCQ